LGFFGSVPIIDCVITGKPYNYLSGSEMEGTNGKTMARLHALTTMIPEFVVIYGLDGRIRWVSNSACGFVGLPAEALRRQFLNWIYAD
jgi:PAS domain-containing protein